MTVAWSCLTVLFSFDSDNIWSRYWFEVLRCVAKYGLRRSIFRPLLKKRKKENERRVVLDEARVAWPCLTVMFVLAINISILYEHTFVYLYGDRKKSNH